MIGRALWLPLHPKYLDFLKKLSMSRLFILNLLKFLFYRSSYTVTSSEVLRLQIPELPIYFWDNYLFSLSALLLFLWSDQPRNCNTLNNFIDQMIKHPSTSVNHTIGKKLACEFQAWWNLKLSIPIIPSIPSLHTRQWSAQQVTEIDPGKHENSWLIRTPF